MDKPITTDEELLDALDEASKKKKPTPGGFLSVRGLLGSQIGDLLGASRERRQLALRQQSAQQEASLQKKMFAAQALQQMRTEAQKSSLLDVLQQKKSGQWQQVPTTKEQKDLPSVLSKRGRERLNEAFELLDSLDEFKKNSVFKWAIKLIMAVIIEHEQGQGSEELEQFVEDELHIVEDELHTTPDEEEPLTYEW